MENKNPHENIDVGQWFDIEDEEQQQDELSNMIQKERSRVSARMKLLPLKVQLKIFPVYSFQEKKLIRDANRLGVGMAEKKMADASMETVKQTFVTRIKVGGIILACLAILAILLIVIVGALGGIQSMFPWLFPTEDGDPENGMTSQHGASYDNFYGSRVVYKDDDQARVELLNQYNTLIVDVVDNIESTHLAGGKIDVNIAIPTEDNDNYFTDVDMAIYESEYGAHYALLKAIAEEVHTYDFITSSSAFATLNETLDDIGHFGFSSGMIDPIANKIKAALGVDGVVVVQADDPDNVPSIDKYNIIDSAVEEVVSMSIAKQTEKLFIRDYIFSEDNKTMANIPQEQYVSMTFMAKGNVSFKSFSFTVAGIDDDFSMRVVKDDQIIQLSKEIYMEISGQDTIYMFKSDNALNVATAEYANVGDLDLSTGKSLLEIARTSVDSTKYLQTLADTDVLTFNQEGVRVEFNNDTPFMFAEYETKLN